MRSLSLPCSICGQLAAAVTVPKVPDELRGILGGILRTAAAMLALRGVRLPPLVVPSSGYLADAIAPEQLPSIAAALEVTCASCSTLPQLPQLLGLRAQADGWRAPYEGDARHGQGR